MRGSVKIIAQLVFKMWINVLYTLLNGGFVLFSDPIVRGKKRCRIAISDFVTISSLCDLVRVKMAAGKAQIGKLAPDFTAKAVMPDGQFHDLKLSDYRGRVVVHRRNTDTSVGQNKWGCNCHSCINCGWSHTLFFTFGAGKYVVFFFYPLDFTFVCPTEIIAFSDAAEDFRKIGCEVIAASVDSHFSHFAW